LKRAVQTQADRFHPSNILIEDKASGTQLIQELRQDGICEVTPFEPGGLDKTMRLHSVTSTFENGLVFLPKEAPWLTAYVHELTSFPAGKYDDQTDSTSQALNWIKQGTHRYGVLEYFGELASKANPSLSHQEDEFSSGTSPVCPKCQQGGPGQRRHRYHCNHCGQEWRISATAERTGVSEFNF
jgi:predicted phage terminase large subunit-like protein